MTLADFLSTGAHWNPYDFANPVNDQLMFAGREKELKEIRYYLNQASRGPRPINLVLTGPRSAGKTSLLNRVAQEAQTLNFCVSRVNLNEGDMNPFSLFYKIYDAVLVAAVEDGAFAGFGGQVYSQYRQTMDSDEATTGPEELLFPRHYGSASKAGRPLSEPTLMHDLTRIRDTLGKTTVVLFDECDVLGQSRVELQMLRNVFMNTAGFMLVFSGTPKLFPVMEDVFSPIIRQFKKIPVERFDGLEDTLSCINKPLQAIGVPEGDQVDPFPFAADVHQLSGGRPYEIQLLCHFMFKRVENGDAREMAITLDLLDDVRLELETQGSGTDRPVISALKKLSHNQLLHLSALTEFRGTIEQLGVYQRLFSEDAPLPDDDLRSAFRHLSSIGILTGAENGVIRYEGDQFDEIYATYFAASREVQIQVTQWSFQDELNFRLNHVIESFDSCTILHVRPEQDSRQRVQEALEALIGSAARSPAGTLPAAAEVLYGSVLDALDTGVLRIVCVRITALGTTAEVWCALNQDEEEFLAEPAMIELQRRVTDEDASLEAEVFPALELGSRDDILARVQASASPNQLGSFADDHYSLGFNFFDEGDFESALKEFRTAYELDPSVNYGTSAAHLSLLLGHWEQALAFANSALELKVAGRGSDPASQQAIAVYDMAVAHLMMGGGEECLALLQDLAVRMEQTGEVGGYFVTPQMSSSGNIELAADQAEKLSEAVEQASRLLKTLE